VKVVAESRIWKNREEKLMVAKLIYEIGSYDQNYWDISQFENAREFVDYFL
jgi:hypothetical protein